MIATTALCPPRPCCTCARAGTHTPPFGDDERAVIDWWHGLGIQHIAKFADEPRSQSEWDAWVPCTARDSYPPFYPQGNAVLFQLSSAAMSRQSAHGTLVVSLEDVVSAIGGISLLRMTAANIWHQFNRDDARAQNGLQRVQTDH